ncbi:putative D-lactate dehydrogenase [Cutibacterium modestum 30N]|uniref:D-isomer specific 2-hydroxyacid dehydrogenase NAD-binding domain-containing protein n=1 Tax=Cutibacterium modestum TaxID=2559073 RepID=A0AAD1KP50_9ACTN|nr:4-phosphoerythronate dehydrogenase [Cutibacterium modestum HL037PA2]MCP2376565.1 putative D-lactate dehydrogenase [Cutibacterium modestum 28N]MCP2379469.1 putative D-lactate dehydrogenase [Cutibacterium modestum 31N]MCP2380037.1 putative D-lactate dehydrogenase [Cutibacterium modestum 30N]BCY24614.1 hypothetical protein KB1_06040 [Cutibacterium modestum]
MAQGDWLEDRPSIATLWLRVLVYDILPDPQLNDIVEFLNLETLFNDDAIILHVPALPVNHHMIDAKQFAMMCDGVLLITCARGELIRTGALRCHRIWQGCGRCN